MVTNNNLPDIPERVLALKNGRDAPEIWVAYRGIVFDVGKSRLWLNGTHYEHWAGQDLTEELRDAPHGDDVFDRFPIVGRFIPHRL